MSILAPTPQGDANVTMTMTQTVKKVYDNGDADLDTSISSMKVLIGGNEMPIGNGAGQNFSQKVNKFGAPVGESTQKGGMHQMDFMRFSSFLGESSVAPGHLQAPHPTCGCGIH